MKEKVYIRRSLRSKGGSKKKLGLTTKKNVEQTAREKNKCPGILP